MPTEDEGVEGEVRLRPGRAEDQEKEDEEEEDEEEKEKAEEVEESNPGQAEMGALRGRWCAVVTQPRPVLCRAKDQQRPAPVQVE
eukprot:CAMPEP_0206502336 /NCGR_PEP_ID=MMETSP0324_2-20121206/53935_1 /ASSEMBLY_ACC=CAM_ASM_000836 /TAXON_ID=2866 /ORGANISM="Crypthecodinium cohnii, Strain Seligo" /LENGTH=84 /DNA_ID=CAMNT_0053990507 /DNA_START=925 /DNA_END=1176 /DNA_ORIENTATION=+